MRHDHIVDKATLCRDKRVGEPLLVFPGAGCDLVRIVKLRPIQDLGRTFSAHNGDFSRRPAIVDIGADMLGRHHVIRAPICLAG